MVEVIGYLKRKSSIWILGEGLLRFGRGGHEEEMVRTLGKEMIKPSR